jgi:hypothetical protein
MKNFPLRRILDQLALERGITHKDTEVFELFDNFPFNPSLDTRRNFFKNLNNGKKNPTVLQEKIWEARRMAMNSSQKKQILVQSILFDKRIKKLPPEKRGIVKSLYLFILQESLKTFAK